ncbi:protein of unknown function [Microbacterium sp. Nx66]|nr:protein of unknown function [Microbacterium sp. Nx66]
MWRALCTPPGSSWGHRHDGARPRPHPHRRRRPHQSGRQAGGERAHRRAAGPHARPGVGGRRPGTRSGAVPLRGHRLAGVLGAHVAGLARGAADRSHHRPLRRDERHRLRRLVRAAHQRGVARARRRHDAARARDRPALRGPVHHGRSHGSRRRPRADPAASGPIRPRRARRPAHGGTVPRRLACSRTRPSRARRGRPRAHPALPRHGLRPARAVDPPGREARDSDGGAGLRRPRPSHLGAGVALRRARVDPARRRGGDLRDGDRRRGRDRSLELHPRAVLTLTPFGRGSLEVGRRRG